MFDKTDRSDSSAPWRWNRFGIVFAAVWMVFLVGPFVDSWNLRGELRGWTGMFATLAFATLYLFVFARTRIRRQSQLVQPTFPESALILSVLTALAAVMITSVGATGLAAAPYLAVTAVMMLPTVAAGIYSLAVAATVEIISMTADWGNFSGVALGVCAAAFAMSGVMTLIRRNAQMLREREEQEKRAVLEERARMARDLHDILGHSLTVITVKAELAGRLLDVDVERARAELDDLERLSRDALADVRSAVEGFRGLSLPVEIARAREALRAAGIEAEVPGSTDVVPTRLRELFAWTIREGVTNVVRHSGARQCRISVDRSSVSVSDDGRGSVTTGSGNGLIGLRERAGAAGAKLIIAAPENGGFTLQVTEKEAV
ncbi:sensor histidine kinase [Rhodococcus sp. 27YEA15]|uniref:sensor histidine kinase n=1 Tax=Rhodococcus sp. 27YEA15 TaxID=3156259 RepID=UPI003C7A5D59